MNAKRHYDDLAKGTAGHVERKNMRTYPIRQFNNSIKIQLLEGLKGHIPEGCSILDLCCGRGGDIDKYKPLNPSFVLFNDISGESVREAESRYASKEPGYDAKFTVYNSFSQEFVQVAKSHAPFNLVVCNFALHYAFKDTTSLDAFSALLRDCLAVGGYLLATVPSYNAIRARGMKEDGTISSFGNTMYKVEFPQPLTKTQTLLPGASYDFTLEDAVDHCREYLIPPTLLTNYLTKGDMSVPTFTPFAQLMYVLKVNPPKQKEIQDVCFMYEFLPRNVNQNRYIRLGKIGLDGYKSFARVKGFSYQRIHTRRQIHHIRHGLLDSLSSYLSPW
jgi:mRNA (guanine-N7-)-methyltransferase